MHKNIEKLLNIIATANDLFTIKYPQISTIVGVLEQRLEESTAVTVENISLGQKLMFIVLDAHTEMVGVGTGKSGTEDFTFIEQCMLIELSTDLVIGLMEDNLLNA